MLRQLFTFCALVFFAWNATASDYKSHVADSRVLLVFNAGVTDAQKADCIKQYTDVVSFTHVPSPAVTICFCKNTDAALQYFAARTEVKFVSVFLTDGLEHYAGVLNNFFVRIQHTDFEPLMRNELKARGIQNIRPDKYMRGLYLIEMPASTKTGTIEMCEQLQALPYVKYATPNYLLNPLVTSNDPLYNRQWNIENTGGALQGSGTVDADMDVAEAWGYTTGIPGIKISIVDSGVDTLHPDLIRNILPGHDAVDDSTDGYPTPNYQEDGHGTCCAGIVAAEKDNGIGVSGVAPECGIIPVRAFYYLLLQGASGPIPYSTSAAFSQAISWSWQVGGADILSNSWGLPPTLLMVLPGGPQPVEDAINEAYQYGRNGKGCAMFFSSGNENGSGGPLWPGSMPNTIAVNATNMCDTRKAPGDCSGENWGGDHGGNLDFSAPGVRIASTDISGNLGFSAGNYYYTFNGTSAACPNAAAVGALVLSLRSDLDAEGVRNVLAFTCDKVGGYGYDSTRFAGSWCNELGYGRINALRAVELAPQYSSISETETKNNLSIYPNPCADKLNIALTAMQQTLNIYRPDGALMQTVNVNEGINQISTALWPNGVYIVMPANGTVQSALKLVVIHR